MLNGVEQIRKGKLMEKSKIVNDSMDLDSEFIDLTQDDESSFKEIDNDFNLNNLILLGKKTERKKEDEKNTQDKKKIMDNMDNIINEGENSIPSNINSIDLDYEEINTEIEKEKLLQLVKKEGFDKVFNLLTKTQFDMNNPLEKELEEIIYQMGSLRVTLILLQIKFSQPQISLPEIVLNPYSLEESKRGKENKELENEGYKLGEHLHKEKDGKIYKYFKHHIRIRGYVFYCADKKCKSKALYNTNTMKFKIMAEHSITYEKHSYISNKDKYEQDKNIFDDFNKKNCTEAQVFKNEDGDKLVKWYNN